MSRNSKVMAPPATPAPPSETQEQLQQIGRILLEVNPSAVSIVPNQGKLMLARVLDVHDGDTVQVLVLLGGAPFKLSVRVRGIDAPEITKKGETTQKEVNVSKKIRDYVRILIPHDSLCFIVLECKDVYCGRYVGDLIIPGGERLSEHLLKIGCVKPYGGDKKNPWTMEELEMIDSTMNQILSQQR